MFSQIQFMEKSSQINIIGLDEGKTSTKQLAPNCEDNVIEKIMITD